MNSNDFTDSATGQNMNSSQQTSLGPSALSNPSPPLTNPVRERVPDSNAYYQLDCFNAYLFDLAMLNQSERESQLSSIANRIKSGYRQLPNPKHILAMIRFNDQGRMHFKFWLRMNNPWPFTGSVEEMELWHEVDALSTQLYEMVYDQAQINSKQKVDDQAEKLTNAPNGPDQSGSSNDVNAHSVPSSSAEQLEISKKIYFEASSGSLTLNEDKSQSLHSDNSNDDEDDHHPTALINPSAPISMRSNSSSNSQLISTTTKSSRISNPPTRKSTRISTSKPLIPSNISKNSKPKAQTPTQPSTLSNPIITDNPSYTIIKSKSQINPTKTRTTYQCCIGECTQVMPDWFHLKRHQCTHTGIKPYRCAVSGCGYASVRKSVVCRHVQSIHYPRSKKGPTFFEQFVETDEELLHSIPCNTSTSSGFIPPSKLNSPTISTTIKSSNISNSSNISISKPSIVSKVSKKSASRTLKNLISKSSRICPDESLISESSDAFRIRRSQKNTTTSSPTSTQPSTSSNLNIPESQSYTITNSMYQCRFGLCTVTMSNWSDFKRHQLSHIGIKPYRCSVSGCSGYASVYKSDVRRHIQAKHCPNSKKDCEFLNQFVETDEELLNNIPSMTCIKSDSIPQSKFNSPKASTKIKPSNISNSSKISKMKPSISFRTSRKSVSRISKTLVSKSSSESPTTESSTISRSRRFQTNTTITPTPTPTQPSTSFNPNNTETQSYTIIESKSRAKMYQCRIGQCTVTMRNWYNFKIHQHGHTGVKPFRCSVSGCSGYAATRKGLVRSHIQLKHYPKSKKEATFLNQFIETDQKLLNSIQSKTSMNSDSRPPIIANPPKALTTVKSSNISLSSKVSKMKPSIAYKTSRNSGTRLPKTLMSKSSKESSTTGLSENFISRRSQTRTFTTTPTPTQPSTSSNPTNTETPSYVIIKSKSECEPSKTRTLYKCRIGNCTKVIRSRIHFIEHQRAHAGVKPFRCSVSGCTGYASVEKCAVRRHIQAMHFPESKDAIFLNQFVETDEQLLNSVPSTIASRNSVSMPPSENNSPEITINSSNNSNSSKISTLKSSIASKASSNSDFRPSNVLISKSSTSGSSNTSTSRRTQAPKTIIPTIPPQASTSSNTIITKTPLYTQTVYKNHQNNQTLTTIYECHIGECNKVMRFWSRFKLHQRAHTGVKPFRCSVTGCAGYAAVQKSKVQRHIQQKHYANIKLDTTFLNQFIETDEELLGK